MSTDKNPIPADSHSPESDSNQWLFELSDYLNILDDDQWPDQDDHEYPPESFVSSAHVLVNQANNEVGDSGASSGSIHFEGSSSARSELGEKKGVRERVAFKTKSEVEILDDGFRWRKYGKKMVKHSPNPRNYYRCSVDGCPVKKRVERDKDDPSYVITTYEGTHTHPSSY